LNEKWRFGKEIEQFYEKGDLEDHRYYAGFLEQPFGVKDFITQK